MTMTKLITLIITGICFKVSKFAIKINRIYKFRKVLSRQFFITFFMPVIR